MWINVSNCTTISQKGRFGKCEATGEPPCCCVPSGNIIYGWTTHYTAIFKKSSQNVIWLHLMGLRDESDFIEILFSVVPGQVLSLIHSTIPTLKHDLRSGCWWSNNHLLCRKQHDNSISVVPLLSHTQEWSRSKAALSELLSPFSKHPGGAGMLNSSSCIIINSHLKKCLHSVVDLMKYNRCCRSKSFWKLQNTISVPLHYLHLVCKK